MKGSNLKISKREFFKRSAAISAGMLCYPCSKIFAESPDLQKSKYKRIAMYQEETARGIMCRICPNECVLAEGETSRCRNRVVYNSKLYTMAYGNPCSVNIDPVEKKPLFHFFPGSKAYSIATAGCNLACLNCQNWTISQTSPDKTRNYELPPSEVVADCIRNNCKSIAYTYSEPVTFYEYVYETAQIARSEGVKNIIKSNGYINPEPQKKLVAFIDAVNIDLKGFSEGIYLKLTGGKLQPVLDSLKVYRDSGVWLEITNLVIPRWSDDLNEIRKMCKWLNDNGFNKAPLHFSRFYPMHKLEQLPPTPVELLNKAVKIAREEGMLYVYTGNVPGDELANTYCPGCNTLLVGRQGFRVTSNSIRNKKCPKCSGTVDGIWQ